MPFVWNHQRMTRPPAANVFLKIVLNVVRLGFGTSLAKLTHATFRPLAKLQTVAALELDVPVDEDEDDVCVDDDAVPDGVVVADAEVAVPDDSDAPLFEPVVEPAPVFVPLEPVLPLAREEPLELPRELVADDDPFDPVPSLPEPSPDGEAPHPKPSPAHPTAIQARLDRAAMINLSSSTRLTTRRPVWAADA